MSATPNARITRLAPRRLLDDQTQHTCRVASTFEHVGVALPWSARVVPSEAQGASVRDKYLFDPAKAGYRGREADRRHGEYPDLSDLLRAGSDIESLADV